MKRIIYILATAMMLIAVDASAQMGKKAYVNAGWQFNGTPGNDFAESAQGYGAYIETGYYLTPMIAIGGFASFSTNNQYYPKETYTFADRSALTTDLDKSIYQVPFGSTVRVRFLRGMYQPYFEARIGTEYSVQNIYMSTFVSHQDNWGFYVSPEVGMTFFPFHDTDLGFHIAAYYSYAANQNKTFDIKGINNLGFKLGVAF
jgi:hypothetical protein